MRGLASQPHVAVSRTNSLPIIIRIRAARRHAVGTIHRYEMSIAVCRSYGYMLHIRIFVPPVRVSIATYLAAAKCKLDCK